MEKQPELTIPEQKKLDRVASGLEELFRDSIAPYLEAVALGAQLALSERDFEPGELGQLFRRHVEFDSRSRKIFDSLMADFRAVLTKITDRHRMKVQIDYDQKLEAVNEAHREERRQTSQVVWAANNLIDSDLNDADALKQWVDVMRKALKPEDPSGT